MTTTPHIDKGRIRVLGDLERMRRWACHERCIRDLRVAFYIVWSLVWTDGCQSGANGSNLA